MSTYNDKSNTVTILGSGTSTGIPIIGCKCSVCLSENPKDKRLRTSILIETKSNKTILVDTTPDFRTQALRAKIDHVDGAIITHDHADHVHGIDDLRPLCFGPPPRNIPVFVEKNIKEHLEEKFPYIFKRESYFSKGRPILGGGIPKLDLHEVKINQEEKILEEDFIFFSLPHGHTNSLGFYHQGFAYIIDCESIPEEVLAKLEGLKVDLLIIDCVKSGTHNTHLTFEKARDYIERTKPKRAGLIHMGHGLGHEQLEKMCNEIKCSDVFPTYDEQKLKY
ncbi:beta-lactamase family protein [Bacteriovorax sp. BSW11_IV]|uniref:MBL fold metallo-hydrolase n=1 Tax=Bacteriovorax sp. BSW11_IV TaxID=1353529 RepID=UPI000389EFB3|nr:MBL fold metallo-hydrolase [Bacteriovorax sp. BSW11_IV]EQC44978.1 beta-lactamase family protein [Bacteriovorax sp. BSW11_IV]